LSYLVVLVKAIYHVYWCAFYRLITLFRPLAYSIPKNSREISAQWIETVLSSGNPESISQIDRVEIEQRSSGTTDRSGVTLHYDTKTGRPPGKYFVKARAIDWATGVFGALFELGITEVRFYSQIQSQVGIKTPKAFLAKARDAGGDFILLLEDLVEQGAVFKSAADKCNLEETEQIIRALATLHARFWQTTKFDSEWSWVQSSSMDKNKDLQKVIVGFAFKKVFRDFNQLIPDSLLENQSLLESTVEKVHRLNKLRPETLLHGDPHIGNTYFTNGKVGLLDWQVLQRGCGMKDISYFMILSVPEKIRTEHQWALIAQYVECLKAHGVDNYSLEMAREDYIVNSIHPFVAALVTVASGAMQEADIAEQGLLNSTKALLDLDALDVFEHM